MTQTQIVRKELSSLAAQVTHGWKDDPHYATIEDLISQVAALDERLYSGERIIVTCGTITRIGVRRMEKLGLPARLVGSLTMDTPDNLNDGHVMMEVKADNRWQLFDLDNNLYPVDANGQGIAIRQFCFNRVRLLRVMARDRLVDWTGTFYEEKFHSMYDGPQGMDRWYNHILNIPLIYEDPYYGPIYMTETDPARISQALKISSGIINLSLEEWRAKFYTL